MKTKVPFAPRALLLCAVVLGISSTIAARLVDLQIADTEDIGKIAAEELIDKEVIPAQRGRITDRNGEMLTNNIQSESLVADRYHLRELNVVVEGLAYNQAIHDERWEATENPKERQRIVKEYIRRLMDNATLKLTQEERQALRSKLKPGDAAANRLLDYDQEVCQQYFALHDQLVAEVLYPFLSHTEVEDTTPVEPEYKTVTTRDRKGRKVTTRVPVQPKKRMRFITREDIVEKIAQRETEEYNRRAKANGEPTKTIRNNIVLARGLSLDTADKLREALRSAHIHGLTVQSDMQRSYVMPEMLCHVLGFVNHENKGQSGIEEYYQDRLAGINGLREYRHNGRGQVLANEDDRYLPPTNGLNIRLTIDMRIQTILEQELDKGMRHFRAKHGCMIAVDPKTGDILGMVSRPAFDLNTKELITPNGKFKRGTVMENDKPVTGDFNFACQTRYEPGSTFKVIAATTALDIGKLKIGSRVDCHPFAVGNAPAINDGRFNYGSLPLWGVLAKSCNPGTAHVALMCKWPNYKNYVHRYGLDKPADICLPAGGPCAISDGSNIVNLSRMAYGYAVSVSPLHMAMVYSTIANGGVRMKPRLIDAFITDEGETYDAEGCAPKAVERVMSEKTAADLRYALEAVTKDKNPEGVNRGTATAAAIPGFRIGGKTGTAKKVHQGGKGYYEGLYTVSFAGVLPIDDPRLVIMTVIDEPHPTDCNPGGGTVAAPIFHAAAERIINLLNLTPSDPEAYERYRNSQNLTVSTAQQ